MPVFEQQVYPSVILSIIGAPLLALCAALRVVQVSATGWRFTDNGLVILFMKVQCLTHG